VNTASIDFYLSNPSNLPADVKRKLKEEEKLDPKLNAREINLLSRSQKRRLHV